MALTRRLSSGWYDGSCAKPLEDRSFRGSMIIARGFGRKELKTANVPVCVCLLEISRRAEYLSLVNSGELQHLHQVKEGGHKSGQRDLPLSEGQTQIAHQQGRPSTRVRRGAHEVLRHPKPSDFELLGHAFVPTYERGVKGGLSVKK
jgi:hypothetical protein